MFAPIARHETIRLVIVIAANRNQPLIHVLWLQKEEEGEFVVVSSYLVICYVVACIMASKRGRIIRGSSSRVSPAPNAPTFPNMKFLSEANAENI